MAAIPPKTLSWLYSVLGREYRHPDRAYSDIAQLLLQHPIFAPRTDVYTYENGISALLIHLEGTIPASFRTETYRIPIALWIPHSYPYEAPLIYVKPTKGMAVRPGQHVDEGGKVYHQYLAQWRDQWDKSNILEFLTILSMVFAREPPVISNQQMSTASLGHQQSPGLGPPIPPLPEHLQIQLPSNSGGARGYGQPIAPPPPPKESATTSTPGIYSPDSPSASRYDAPPPLPSKVDGPGSTQKSYPIRANGSMSGIPQSGQHPPQRNSSLRQSVIPRPQVYSQQVPDHQQLAKSDSIRQIHGNQPAPSSPALAQSFSVPQSRSLSQMWAAGSSHQQMLQQHQPTQPPSRLQPQASQRSQYQRYPQQPPNKPPPVNLLDSPFNVALPVASNLPAPPVPRNPEKDALLSTLSQTLTQTLHDFIAQTNSALPSLQAQRSALASTYQKLESEIQNLSTLTSSLQSNNKILQISLSNADKAIANAKERAKQGDVPKVDEMLTAPTVVGKQLYDVVCEERGIEAAMWALQEGFVRGRIGSEIWAKKTRELAREGFRKRVVARKIGEGMGLDGVSERF